MKTRKEIIAEILAQHRQHNSVEHVAQLNSTLQSMQDVHVFQLAQDLNIDLISRARESGVRS